MINLLLEKECKNKDYLYEKYITMQFNGKEIAKINNIPERTIYSWLVKFNIPRRKSGVKNWSEKQKEYRRQWNKNHPEINRMKGKKHRPETKAKMSLARQGSDNKNWQGGLTAIKRGIKRSPEYYNWRKSVLLRDNYVCCLCKMDNSKIAHHIKSFKLFPNLRFDIKNGITLCKECHLFLHFGGN